MMDQELNKPPLDPGTYQSIELEQYELHKRHMAALRELQVLALTGESTRPKDPQRLEQGIATYAQSLFDAEANRYPTGGRHFVQWLEGLAGRVEEMMGRRIWEMDTTSVAKLTYHATREEIDAMMRSALVARVDALLAARRAPVPVSRTPELPPGPPPIAFAESVFMASYNGVHPLQMARTASTAEAPQLSLAAAVGGLASQPFPAAPRVIPVGEQIRSLRTDSRFTIDELAKKVGIASRTVQRHESGEVQEIRLRHVRDYEKVFSATLKRPIRLQNVCKTSHS